MKLLESRLLALGSLVAALSLVAAGSAQAFPSLQLGPGAGSWTYDTTTRTWVTGDNAVQLAATANATRRDGGNGAYAWDTRGSSQVAYLVVSAARRTALSEPPEVFDITIMNDAVTLSPFSSGNGSPPLSNPNALPRHGILSTYFEIYEFNFDGERVGISNTRPVGVSNTRPGRTRTGMGYLELFDIRVNSRADSVERLDFDLYTVHSRNPGRVDDIAPFSHDAGTIPEPRSALLFGVGGLITSIALHRRR